jgi:hypothetical protein
MTGADDPRPLPPREPDLEECCKSGCEPCVFDHYYEAHQRYREALAAWLERHPGANDDEPPRPVNRDA